MVCKLQTVKFKIMNLENLGVEEMNKKEIICANGGGDIFDGVTWWEASGQNPVVGVANAAYNAGVIAGNIMDEAMSTGVSMAAKVYSWFA